MLIEKENLKEKIRKVQKKDKGVVKMVEKLKWSGMKILKSKEWSIEKELVLKKDQIYVSEEELRTEIIQLHHNTPVEGHGGRWKIAELVRRNYWWPEMTKKVERYIDGYNVC